MKCTTPTISWHNKKPVLSIDIFPDIGQSYRVASAGADSHVLIWQMKILENGAVNQELISDLTKHQKAVNCVRWSGSGKYLASADDDANIIIWQLKTDNIPLLEGDTGDKEIWIAFKIMRGHKEDIYDICWSKDETKIVSASIDNTAIIWDVSKGKMDHIMSDHKGFVQGVAWDPRDQFIATISTDRICRLFDVSGKCVKARIHNGKITSAPEGHFLKNQQAKYFHDDTFKSFFRRLHFTPDGSLLIVPSGQIEVANHQPVNATLIFTLDNLISPAIILPTAKQSSTVVRVCPVLYKLREDGPDPVIVLPYRMVFAVGTDHDVILYDTQQHLPFARVQDIHYTRVTDLTWSLNGQLLIASSTDGYCTLITFNEDEIGEPWVEIETKEDVMEISGCADLDKDENVDTNNRDVKEVEDVKVKAKKRTNFLEQWALKTSKKMRIGESDEKAIESDDIQIIGSPMKDAEKMDVDKPQETINKLIPRRKESIEKTPNKNSEKQTLVPKQIKPTSIEPIASTSKIKDNHDEEITKSDNDEGSSESEEELSQEEQDDYIWASQNIKKLFPKKPQTLEKPAPMDITQTREKVNVLVPRRVKLPCAESEKIISTNSELNVENKESALIGEEKTVQHSKELLRTGSKNSKNIEEKKSSDAKPIAVKRKSRASGAKKGEASSEPKNGVNVPVEQDDVKPIQAEKKLIEPKINNDKGKSIDTSLIEISSQESSIPEKANLRLSPPKEEKVDIKTDAVIDLVSDDSNQVEISTPKKSKTGKPTSTKKVTPSRKPTAKSLNSTPRKQTSTLLNFLQKTQTPPKTNKEEKVNKSQNVSDETIAKETSDKKAIQRLSVEVLDDEEKDEMVQASEKSSDTKKSLVYNKQKTKIINDTEKNLVEGKQEVISDSKKDFVEQIEDSKNNLGESKQAKTTDTNKNVFQSTQDTPKTPRRVPLITLASPSRKIKK